MEKVRRKMENKMSTKKGRLMKKGRREEKMEG